MASLQVQYLYHYTNEDGKDGIIEDKIIAPSNPIVRDAYFGKGVYFTSLSPNNSTNKIMINNWDGVRGKKEYTEWYIRVNTNEIAKLHKVTTGGRRDVYMTLDAVYLNQVEYAYGQRNV